MKEQAGVAVGVPAGVPVGVGVGEAVGVGLGLGAPTVKMTVLKDVQPFFVALRTTLKSPSAVGVPEIRPPDVSTVKPGGSPVAL